MATTVARDKYIGRVGALAVALGIGTAIVGMPGAAWADPDGGSASSSATQAGDGTTTSEKPSRVTSRKDRTESGSSATAGSSSASSADGGTHIATGDGAEATPSKRGDGTAKRAAAAAAKRAERRPAAAQAKAGSPSDELSAQGAVTSTTTTAATVPTTGATEPTGSGLASPGPARKSSTKPIPASETVAAQADTPTFAERAPKIVTALRTLFAPHALTSADDAPEAPAASPLLWTMLAYARRQTGGQLIDVTPTAATTSAARDVSAAAVSPALPGSATNSPVIGADGTVYQVTEQELESYRVTIIDKNGNVVATTGDIAGNLANFAPPTARPDGTLIVVATRGRGTIFSPEFTDVSIVDDQGTVTKITSVRGQPFNPDYNGLKVSPGGDIYFSTVQFVPKPITGSDAPYRTFRITADNAVRTYPYDTDVAFASGNTYLVSSQYGINTLRVINGSGQTRITPLPFGSTPSAPIVGQDGNVYVVAGTSAFGGGTTRVYTVTGAATAVRTISGTPGRTVTTADGLVVETFSTRGSSTTYISTVTGTGVVTSGPIVGRIAGLQVTADGAVYAPVAGTAATTAVAVVDREGTVTTVTLPGTLVTSTPAARGGGTQSAGTVGYVNYSAGGREYVAALNPDGTVASTVALPEGASGGTVFYGPDGAAHELLIYRNAAGQPVSQQIYTPATNTFTANIPGSRIYRSDDDVVFGPDGTAYLLTGQDVMLANGNTTRQMVVTGFDSAGNTVLTSPALIGPGATADTSGEATRLVFDRNGVAYASGGVGSADARGVYALLPGGAQRVADASYLPTFGLDNTGYAASERDFFAANPTTVVTTFTPPSAA